MRDDIAIRVENLGKCYQIGQAKSGDLRQSFAHWWDGLRGRSNGQEKAAAEKEFWALKDINFEIKRGEAVGIIGRNGAGKSTLLKILSRITEPSTGRFEINGRVSSLLEVGTGFHPELSGRENIYLNGTILGMKRREVKAKFDEIVAFSGVEKFIDTPVKHYSSGMKVRLAFSVAAHLEPEILIIDEVLAVGDAEFQKKCLGKMDEVSKGEGRTVIFVSHDMSAVEGLCSSGVLLDMGRIKYRGRAKEAVENYITLGNQKLQGNNLIWGSDKKIRFEGISLMAENRPVSIYENVFQVPFNSLLDFVLDIVNEEDSKKHLFFAISILDHKRIKIATLDNLYTQSPLKVRGSQKIVCKSEKLPLNPGLYHCDLWISDGFETLQKIEQAFEFQVMENNYLKTGRLHQMHKHGYLNLENVWSRI